MSYFKLHTLWVSTFALAASSMPALAQVEAPIPLLYESAAREAPPVARKDTCAIHIVATSDQRQNKQTLGATIRGPLLSGDASPWVTDGLMQLKDFGYAVQRADAGSVPSSGVLVKTTITRAYTWQVGLKLFGMIALKAQFVGKDGVLQDKYYRAHGDKTNMWGASAEYITTLNYGLNNLLREMAVDLGELCKGAKVDAFTYAGPDPKPAAK